MFGNDSVQGQKESQAANIDEGWSECLQWWIEFQSGLSWFGVSQALRAPSG